MKITELIHQPEGRRVEFKSSLPTVSDLAKTIVAFANDAGGDLFIGIKNEQREITRIAEDDSVYQKGLPAGWRYFDDGMGPGWD